MIFPSTGTSLIPGIVVLGSTLKALDLNASVYKLDYAESREKKPTLTCNCISHWNQSIWVYCKSLKQLALAGFNSTQEYATA